VATTIDEGFEQFLRKLTPTEAEQAAAARHSAELQRELSARFPVERFWQTGSFDNGTAVHRYSAVDYFALISWQRPGDSTLALTAIRDALKERFPSARIRADRPAVVVEFSDLNYDIIPAFQAGAEFVCYIPGPFSGWITASPDAHQAYVNDCDYRSQGIAKNMARLLKAWKYANDVPVSSFYLEMYAATYMARNPFRSWLPTLNNLFTELLYGKLAEVHDPTGAGARITACETETQREETLSKLRTAYTRSSQAVWLDSNGMTPHAFLYIDEVFNGIYPAHG